MTPFEARFWEKVDRSGECWTWLPMVAGQRYGRVRLAGQKLLAHRVAYELEVGPIPLGLEILHGCDNDACVRPSHLRVGTHAQNMQDASAKGRIAHGERVGKARLTAASVLAIREARARGVTTVELGRVFGVNSGTISRAARGDTWAHPFPDVGAFATGGTVGPGHSYLVGESGPELVIPVVTPEAAE
jgi:hypothetical protein